MPPPTDTLAFSTARGGADVRPAAGPKQGTPTAPVSPPSQAPDFGIAGGDELHLPGLWGRIICHKGGEGVSQ